MIGPAIGLVEEGLTWVARGQRPSRTGRSGFVEAGDATEVEPGA